MGYMVYIMHFRLIHTKAVMCWRVRDIFGPGSHRVGNVKGDAKESGGVDRQWTGRRGNDVADSARGTEDGVKAAARSWRWADKKDRTR